MKPRALAASALFLAAYGPIWYWMADRWMAAGSYYSHGFLIPLISAYLVWKEKGSLVLSPDNGRGWGLAVVALGLFGLVVSAFWTIYFAGAATLIAVLLGSVVYLWGFAPLRALLFPILFLGFMIPIPLVTVADISLKLKLLAAATALNIIEFFGIVAVRDGSYLHFTNGTMIVGDVCSGLRSLIALLAFGAFFAYLSKLPRWGKTVLFLASMPIAWIANIVRIVALCFIGQAFSIEAAGGIVHDTSGILIFVVAFIMLFSVEKLLRRFAPREAPRG